MQRRKLAKIIIFLLLTTFLAGLDAWAQDLKNIKEIKESMRARLAAVDILKDKGIIGENNRGYLEFREGARQQDDLVAAENYDRQKVYDAIARQQGTTVDFVGKRRARQIAESAPAGAWLQDEAGTWYKKP